jgi:hypothetical protein
VPPGRTKLVIGGIVTLYRLARMPAPHPMQGHVSALAVTLGAKVDLVAGDVDAARERLVEGYRVGVATKDMPVVAGVGVGVAMFAAALERPLDAAEIVGAAARLRGADDRSSPDLIALRANVVTQVGAPTFESAYSRGRSMDRENAIARLDPALLEH